MTFTLGRIANSVGLKSVSNSLNKKANDITNSLGTVTTEILANTVRHLRDGIDRHGGLARSNRAVLFLRTPEYSLFNKNYMSVAFGLSNGFVQSFLDDPRDIGILCETVTMPGSSLNTYDYSLMAHSQKMVSGFTNSEFSIGFIVTNDFFIPRMFKGWETSIIDRYSNRIKYKDSYTRDIYVVCYDDNNIPTYVLKIMKAFPIQQSEMTFDENDMNNYQKYTVTFSYEDFMEYSVSEMFGDLSDVVSDKLKSFSSIFENVNTSDENTLFGGKGSFGNITTEQLSNNTFNAIGNPTGTISSSELPIVKNPYNRFVKGVFQG